MTRAGSAEDEVELWKSDNYIARTSNQAIVDKETMLQGLKDKKLVYIEEINRNNEIIIIKKKRWNNSKRDKLFWDYNKYK